MRKWLSYPLKRLPPTVLNFIKKTLFKNGLFFDEVYLVEELFKSLPNHPVMLDLGANQGNSCLPFAVLGWKVYCFEPDPRNLKTLHKRYKGYKNVNIIDKAVSNKVGTQKFYLSSIPSINSLHKFDPTHSRTIDVITTTLDKFVKDENIKKIDFLKIDVEGYDLIALKSLNMNKIKPSAILIEFEDRKTKSLGYNFEDMIKYLSNFEYKLYIFEYYPIIKYGENNKLRRTYKYPGKLIDRNAWGNILAIDKSFEDRFDVIYKLFK